MAGLARIRWVVLAAAATTWGCGSANLSSVDSADDGAHFVQAELTTGGPSCSCFAADPNVLLCPSATQPGLYDQQSCADTGGCRALATGGACCGGACAGPETGAAECMCGMSGGQPAMGCFRPGESTPYEVRTCACRTGAAGAYCETPPAASGPAPEETQAPPATTQPPVASVGPSCPTADARDVATNNTPEGAHHLGDLPDSRGLELTGSIGNTDANDWYRFHHVDVPLAEGRSYRVVGASTALTVCAYAFCDNGEGVTGTMLSCGQGQGREDYRTINGVTYQGCCGPAGLDRYDEAFRLHVACNPGLFSDDSADVYVRVSTNVPACVDYRLYL